MQSIAENHKESSQMYAEFAKVADGNEYAWSYGSKAETEESIGAVTKRNRMICLPCKTLVYPVVDDVALTHQDPLLMNAFNTINLAGAVILTSTDNARKLGIPSEKWIYPLGGAGTRDSDDCTVVYPRTMSHRVLIASYSLGTTRVLVESLDLEVD